MENETYKSVKLFFLVMFVLFVCLLIFFFLKMAGAQLTNVEAGMFAVCLSMVTTSISILISIRMSESNLRNTLKTHGKLAMRRVSQSIKGCEALLRSLCVKKIAIE